MSIKASTPYNTPIQIDIGAQIVDYLSSSFQIWWIPSASLGGAVSTSAAQRGSVTFVSGFPYQQYYNASFLAANPQFGQSFYGHSYPVIYTPNENFSGLDFFSYTFYYQTDITKQFGNTVGAGPIYAGGGSVQIQVGKPVSVPVSGLSALLTTTATSIGLGGKTQLSWQTSGASIVYFNDGYLVNGRFQPPLSGSREVSPSSTTTYILTAQNSAGQTAASSVTVAVSGAVQPPVTTNLSLNASKNSPTVFSLPATGDITRFSVTANPSFGSLVVFNTYPSINSVDPSSFIAPIITYNYNSIIPQTIDTFQFIAIGPGGTSNTATITLNLDTCQTPVITPSSQSKSVAYAGNVTVSWSLSGTVNNFIVTDPPLKGNLSAITLNGSTATAVYTPFSNFISGTDAFKIAANNPCGQSLPATVNINLLSPAKPQATNVTFSVNQNETANFYFTYTGIANSVVNISGPINGNIVSTGTPFQYTYNPKVDYSGGDTIRFRVSGPGGVSDNTANVQITVNPGTPLLRPDILNFTSYVNQPSEVTLTGEAKTVTGNFALSYDLQLKCIGDSNSAANVQTLTNSYVQGWSRTRAGNTTITGNTVSIQEGDVIAPIIKTAQAVYGNSRTLTFQATASGNNTYPGYNSVTTFTVTTQFADVFPDNINFFDQIGVEPNSLVVTNQQQISGITPGISLPMSILDGNLLLYNANNTITQSPTLVVSAGSIVAAAVYAPSELSSSKSFSVSLGYQGSTITDDFTVTTRNPITSTPPWNFGNRTNLELNTEYLTPNYVTFSPLEVSGNLAVTPFANVIVNYTDTGSNIAEIQDGDVVAISAVTANTYNTTNVFTVSLTTLTNTVSDTFSFSTRTLSTKAIFFGDFVNLTNQTLNTAVTSNTITVTGFDDTLSITLTTTDATAELLINSIPSGTSNTVVSGDSISISGTTANDNYNTISYNVICGNLSAGGNSKTWLTTTIPLQDLLLLSPC